MNASKPCTSGLLSPPTLLIAWSRFFVRLHESMIAAKVRRPGICVFRKAAMTLVGARNESQPVADGA
jgi:hypothetical protein